MIIEEGSSHGVLKAKVNGVWEEVAGPVPNEVFIGTDEPVEPEVELWFDPDAVADEAGEVHIGPDDPLFLDPTSANELWFDTDEDPAQGMGGLLPDGGLTDEALVKASDADYDAIWAPIQALPPAGAANQALVKASATDGDARWGGDLAAGNITLAAGSKVNFVTEVGDKILLYPAAAGSRFGLGIQSGTLQYFVEQVANKHSFTVGGTERALIDQNGLGPRTNYNVTWENGFSGTAQFRVNPAMVAFAMNDVKRNTGTGTSTTVKMFSIPAGVPAPWMTLRQSVVLMGTGGSVGWSQGDVRVELRSDGGYVTTFAQDDFGTDSSIDCSFSWSR